MEREQGGRENDGEVKRGEGGRTGPKPRPQQMLADALGVDVGSIYGNIAVGVYGDVVVEANKQVIIAALADKPQLLDKVKFAGIRGTESHV